MSDFPVSPPASRAGIPDFFRFQFFFVGERAQRLPLLALLVSQRREFVANYNLLFFISLYIFFLSFFVSLKEIKEKE